MTVDIPLPCEEPSRNRFDDLDIGDEISVIAAVYQDLSVGLAQAFKPEPADVEDPPIQLFRALADIGDEELLREYGIVPETFGPAHEQAQPVLNGIQAVVTWRWDTENVGKFHTLAATKRKIRINGCTVLHNGEEGIVVTRFIDWLEVLGQMGAGVAARTMPAPAAAYYETKGE